MLINRTILFSARICWNANTVKLLVPQQLDKQMLWTCKHFSVSSSNFKEFKGSKSKDDVLIYEGPLVSKIRLAKLFSLSSSMIGLALQPMLYQKTVEAGTGLAVTIGGAVFLGFFTFVTPVLLHLISRKYVTHLLYNSYTEEFTAFTYNIFLFPVETKFKAQDVTRPELPTMFTSFYVRGKPLFADPEYFTSIELYKTMLGYDQPIDLKLSKPEMNKPANVK